MRRPSLIPGPRKLRIEVRFALSYEALKMKGKFSERTTPLMISAMRRACSSLSITQGPAMRKRSPAPTRTSPTWKEEIKKRSLSPPRYFLRTMKHLHRRSFLFGPPLRAMLISRRDKRTEQRMRLQGLRLELRMKLASDEMRMVRQFHHLDVSAIRRRPGDAQSSSHHRLLVFAVKFVTMAVALADLQLAVDLVRQRVRFNLASPGAQP